MKSSNDCEEEYSYLICSRVARVLLHDLYSLYTSKRIECNGTGYIGPVTSLQVDEIIDPEKWLHCVKWTRYNKAGDGHSSLEWFIARPKGSTFYYSVGERGTLLLSKDNLNNAMEVGRETVETYTGESNKFCKDPLMVRIDWEKNKEA